MTIKRIFDGKEHNIELTDEEINEVLLSPYIDDVEYVLDTWHDFIKRALDIDDKAVTKLKTSKHDIALYIKQNKESWQNDMDEVADYYNDLLDFIKQYAIDKMR